jgi:hypothetical protein
MHRPDDDRSFCLPAKHVVEHDSLVQILMEAHPDEVDKHEFGGWPTQTAAPILCR